MTTAVQVQYRRGTASQVTAFTGAQGELVIDTTNNRVVVQDGATAGGWPAAKLSEVVPSVNGLTGTITIAANDGDVVAASGSTITLGGPGGMVNKFRNGTMDVWQRGTGPITITTSGGYGADGWIVLPAGASVTAAQTGGRLLTKNSLQVTGAASVTDVIIKQRVESLIAAALCSQTVTVQAQVYNNTGGSITPLLTVKHAGSQDVWTSPTTDVNAVSLQPCANGSWTQLGYTFPANANSFNGLEIAFDFGDNFGANTKTLQITECDIRVTPGASAGLERQSAAPGAAADRRRIVVLPTILRGLVLRRTRGRFLFRRIQFFDLHRAVVLRRAQARSAGTVKFHAGQRIVVGHADNLCLGAQCPDI